MTQQNNICYLSILFENCSDIQSLLFAKLPIRSGFNLRIISIQFQKLVDNYAFEKTKPYNLIHPNDICSQVMHIAKILLCFKYQTINMSRIISYLWTDALLKINSCYLKSINSDIYLQIKQLKNTIDGLHQKARTNGLKINLANEKIQNVKQKIIDELTHHDEIEHDGTMACIIYLTELLKEPRIVNMIDIEDIQMCKYFRIVCKLIREKKFNITFDTVTHFMTKWMSIENKNIFDSAIQKYKRNPLIY